MPEQLPAVVSVDVLEGHRAARLLLDNGRTVFLSSDITPRATLSPLNNTGQPLLLHDWKVKDGPAYTVPASVFDVVARLFDESRPADKRPLTSTLKEDPAHLPLVVNVESLPEGAARLHLSDGQSVDVEDMAPSFLSPDEYAPALLGITKGQSEELYIVPDALRQSVKKVLGYKLPGEKEGQQ